MLATDQIARNVSGKIHKSVREIYSSNHEYLTQEDFLKIESIVEEFKVYPIYYVDEIGTVGEIEKTIYRFIFEHSPNKEKGTIVTLDHTLMTKGLDGQSEKIIVDNLMHKCVELKKSLTAQG